MLPWFVRPSGDIPPPFGGRGTKRGEPALRSGIRTLLFGPALFGAEPFRRGPYAPPRFDMTFDPLRTEVPLLNTGRANVREGGTAAGLPAFAPSIVVRVGCTSSDRAGDILLNSLGETLTLLAATEREFTMVSRDTAVNPFGARGSGS